MLLAEELALVALKPETGRHALDVGEQLNACLACLLVGELMLDGVVSAAAAGRTAEVRPTNLAASSPTLAAAAEVVAEKGPKLTSVLSNMNRGLRRRLGHGTWEAAVEGLVAAGVLGPASGGLRPAHPLVVPGARDAVVHRLRQAATGDEPIEARTALVLSMTGPANLLEVVAPERSGRRHARRRIDHALDGTEREPLGKVVRKLIADAQAVVVVG